MDTRALTVAIRLLTASVTLATAISLEGCCSDHWGEVGALDLGTEADLHAVESLAQWVDDRIYLHLAVGSAGVVVAWGFDDLGEPFVERTTVGDQPLRAISTDENTGVWWVVGDGGVVAFSDDLGATWTPVDLTTADLRGITSVGSQRVVVGDEIVLVQAADGIWSELLPPEGAWGSLQAVYFDGTRTYAVGLGGVIWSALDPSGPWTREDGGTTRDLVAIGRFESSVAIVGTHGRMVVREPSGWSRPATGVSVDLIDQDDGLALAADGRLFEIGKRRELREIDSFGGARAIDHDGSTGAIVAVGDAGQAHEKPFYECMGEGGRPFVVDGRSRRAAVVRAEAELPERDPLATELARAWADDGLSEHASVASFARFALELLALGAPPSLVREISGSIHDELDHAKLCFALARRFGGVVVEPGPMPVSRRGFERARDPVAVALALLEEGCVNETLAACEAAEMASVCADPETRAVLEILATDERRHAAAAWIALGWMLDRFGERVRGPVRAQLTRLERGRVEVVADSDPFELGLARWGRISPRRRAEVHRRVHAEAIQPLGRALLVAANSSNRADLG